jgi:hypothetical protein
VVTKRARVRPFSRLNLAFLTVFVDGFNDSIHLVGILSDFLARVKERSSDTMAGASLVASGETVA